MERDARRSGALRPSAFVAKPLAIGLVAFVSILFAILALHPSWWWPLTNRGALPGMTLAYGGAYLAVAFLATGPRVRILRHFALAALLLAIYSTLRSFPLGDYLTWRSNAPTEKLYVSEILACITFHYAYAVDGLPALNWVSPIAGAVTALCYFFFCDWFFGPTPRARRVTAVAYLATGFHLLFVVGFNECTQLALPFVIAFLFFVLRIARRARDEHAPSPTSDAILAAVSIALAALVHGQCLFLSPALPMVLLIAHGAVAWRAVVAGVFSFAFVVGAVVGGVALAGFTFDYGHAGGGEGGRFWSLREFWPTKVQHVTNGVMMVAPVLLAWPLIVAAVFRSRAAQIERPERWALHIVTGGAISFVCLWNFDLGFPIDYDLMVNILFPLHVAVIELLLATSKRSSGALALGWGSIALGGVGAWLVMSSLTLEERTMSFTTEQMRAESGRPVLELSVVESGDVMIGVENVPDHYIEGWVLFSLHTGWPVGAGGMYGLEPDHVTVSGWVQKAEVGSVMHFLRAGEDVFPRRAVAMPVAKVGDFVGVVVDAVVVFAVEGKRVIAVSNVVRFRR